MARTPLAHWFEQAVSEVSREARPAAAPVRRTTRRSFLRDAGALGVAVVGAGTLGRLVPAAAAADGPRIVVVGAGLAGLTCTYRLKQAGYRAELHEASSRVGGRCLTLRGAFADGQIGEHGGEFIDTGHKEIRGLAKELGLRLDDVNAAEAAGPRSSPTSTAARTRCGSDDADFRAVCRPGRRRHGGGLPDARATTRPQRGRELDAMSIVE